MIYVKFFQENETWSKLWPVLLAGIIGAGLKYWADNRRAYKLQEETLIRWVRTVHGLRSAIKKQIPILQQYSQMLRSGLDRGTQLGIVITIRCEQFDQFSSYDLYRPLKKKGLVDGVKRVFIVSIRPIAIQ